MLERSRIIITVLFVAIASGCATIESMLPPVFRPGGAQVGIASWYGAELGGQRTASGERFNPGAYTAAHRYHKFGTRLRVTNLHNGRSVVVRVNDRGPHIPGRAIDLSRAAASKIGIIGRGTAKVRIERVK